MPFFLLFVLLSPLDFTEGPLQKTENREMLILNSCLHVCFESVANKIFFINLKLNQDLLACYDQNQKSAGKTVPKQDC